MSRLYFVLSFLLLTLPAHGQGYMGDAFAKPRYFSMDFQYITYSDIVSNSSHPTATIEDIINVNLNARFYRIFSFVTSYGRTSSGDTSYIGLGVRVDLPGFMFISGYANDFVRKRKKRRVNTYLQVSKLLVKEVAQTDRFVDDRMAYGTDIFVASDFYLNIEIGISAHHGNQFFAPAIGLGYEF